MQWKPIHFENYENTMSLSKFLSVTWCSGFFPSDVKKCLYIHLKNSINSLFVFFCFYFRVSLTTFESLDIKYLRTFFPKILVTLSMIISSQSICPQKKKNVVSSLEYVQSTSVTQNAKCCRNQLPDHFMS